MCRFDAVVASGVSEKQVACRTLGALVCVGFSPINGAFLDPEARGARRSGAYNPCMLHALASSLGNALAERLTLLINHVLSSEPVATRKLHAHAGRRLRLQLDGWPALLPPLPDLAFRVTPAGLLEWCGADPPADVELRLRLDASNPALLLARMAAGEQPRVDLQGDAQFAADLSWLADNLRWDVQDDLERLVGRAPAHEIARIARTLAAGLRQTLGGVSGLAARSAPGGSNGDPPEPQRTSGPGPR